MAEQRHDQTSEHAGLSTREWALLMVRQPSVTGTLEEIAFGPWLSDRLSDRGDPHVARDVWTFPVGPDDTRLCVAMLVRGSGRSTVVLTGHYDTVSIDDYGDLAGLATEPELLRSALLRRLDKASTMPSQQRARADLASGAFLPGRGLLDMKAGLAAGIAAAERFGRRGTAGNVLFLAVPDEEASSAGARAAASELPRIARDRDIELVAVVNLDAIADDGDGTSGRAIAFGTIGKVLVAAFVAGVPTHAGFPHAGVNSAVLAAAIAKRVEWAPELTDLSDGPATPPSLLSFSDGKSSYDVTTPAFASAAFNINMVRRSPEDILDMFEVLCREAVAAVMDDLRVRARSFRASPAAIDDIADVRILRFEDLAKQVQGSDALADLQALAHATSPDMSLPERCRRLTERLWRESGWAGPAVVIGFGSMPYLATKLSQSPTAQRLARVAAVAADEVAARHATTVRCDPVFAGISDMSFFGEADEALLRPVMRNTPGWHTWIRWAARGGIAGLPTINAGPWGRDYHTPFERLETHYAFDVLPDLLEAIVGGVLADV